MLEINQIHHGDCLELMHQIPDGSVDMVLADLPYGTTACAWDSIIPLEPLWEHYKRVIKPRGAIVLTAADPFTPVLQMSNWAWYRYKWIWEKSKAANYVKAKTHPLKYYEDVCVFYDKLPTYNPQMVKGLPYKKVSKSLSKKDGFLVDTRQVGHVLENPGHRYPSLIVKIHNGNNDTTHPTEKPVSLFAYLINTYTNPGDLVLDNTAGSGTTAIAAIQTGRDWLCIEKDEAIYQTAANRIAKALGQGFTPAARTGQPNNQNQAELRQRGLWESE